MCALRLWNVLGERRTARQQTGGLYISIGGSSLALQESRGGATFSKSWARNSIFLRLLRTTQNRLPGKLKISGSLEKSGDPTISSHLVQSLGAGRKHEVQGGPQRCTGPSYRCPASSLSQTATWNAPVPPAAPTAWRPSAPHATNSILQSTTNQPPLPAGSSVDHPRETVCASHSRRALSNPLTTHRLKFQNSICRVAGTPINQHNGRGIDLGHQPLGHPWANHGSGVSRPLERQYLLRARGLGALSRTTLQQAHQIIREWTLRHHLEPNRNRPQVGKPTHQAAKITTSHSQLRQATSITGLSKTLSHRLASRTFPNQPLSKSQRALLSCRA